MDRRSTLQTVALAYGAVFLLVGILGFIPGITSNYDELDFAGPDSEAELLGIFQVSILHNIVHVLFGLAGLALARSWDGARAFLIGGGVIYLVLWLYGLLVGQDDDANFVPMNTADDWLHLFLGVTMILAGYLLSREGRRPLTTWGAELRARPRPAGRAHESRIAAVAGTATTSLRELVADEARRAKNAAAGLSDEGVGRALRAAAARVREAREAILEINRADCTRAAESLDEGTLDRLRLDDARIESIARQLEATATIPPLEREVAAWTLPNGLRVSERRIPIGAVGANFEARPNVVLDVAGQLLKSLNAAVLRTGSAALGTAMHLVDEILRPALSEAGLPADAVGLVRSPAREGARVLVSLPQLVPLVILRGSGETTAALARLAAEHGVATLAHAEGGGVLYVHAAAAPERALAVAEASLDRLGVCNRLNLALVDRAATGLLPALLELFARRRLEVRAAPRALELVPDALPLDRRLGYEWANDAERVATVTVEVVDGLDEAVRIANEETSALAAGIVTEDEQAAGRFLERYRGTAAFWHAPTRFADGFELTGVPETGINVGWAPGPRGPVTYRDLWLRQYRVVGDATQTR